MIKWPPLVFPVTLAAEACGKRPVQALQKLLKVKMAQRDKTLAELSIAQQGGGVHLRAKVTAVKAEGNAVEASRTALKAHWDAVEAKRTAAKAHWEAVEAKMTAAVKVVKQEVVKQEVVRDPSGGKRSLVKQEVAGSD